MQGAPGLTENALFQGVAEKRDPPSRVAPGAKPRLQIADRSQMELRVVDLDRLVADDDEVRSVWAFAVRDDQGGRGNRGAPADRPKILVALWLYATLQGVGSARALDRLCESHVAYQWLCGGVSVNYHTLADFRVAHGAILERMLTESVATLMASGVVTLRRVAQDGMRVRASAGAASFRRKATLDECLRAAEEQVKSLRKQLDEDPGEEARRRKAAQLRAAEDRQRRVEEALRQLPAVEEIKARSRRKGDDPKKLEKLALQFEASESIDSPRVAGAAASYECRVLKVAACGDHDLFLGLVTGHGVRDGGKPVVRWGGRSHAIGAALEGPAVKYPH